jgi:S-adenosylmethionine synthetase
MSHRIVFTSESVTKGHPDKICDQVSDALVDAFLYVDPGARVSAECAVATGLVFLAVTSDSDAAVDPAGVARKVIRDIGYTERHGFDPEGASVISNVAHRAPGGPGGGGQRPPGADAAASDQASVFGYACRDTPEGMPLPIALAHRLARRLDEVRRQKVLPYLGPDGKVLVAVEFEERRPLRVHTVVVNVQHAEAVGIPAARNPRALLEGDIREAVLQPVLADAALAIDGSARLFVNPGGAFVVGGPRRDAGLTGRKNTVDTYGGYVRHGGGALSGKDPGHVDRFGAYLTRYAARNIVAAELATECEVHVAYAIGQAEPLTVSVETHGSGVIPDDRLAQALRETIDLRPVAVVDRLELRKLPAGHDGSFFVHLAAYGHFGRVDLGAPWERDDRASELKRAAQALG